MSGRANGCRRMRIGVGGCEWLSVLKNSVVSILRANQCRLGMRISVGTNANTHVIKQWDDIKRIQAFFSDAENSVSKLPETERCIAMAKLAQERELVGELDPLQALLEWKGPRERL